MLFGSVYRNSLPPTNALTAAGAVRNASETLASEHRAFPQPPARSAKTFVTAFSHFFFVSTIRFGGPPSPALNSVGRSLPGPPLQTVKVSPLRV